MDKRKTAARTKAKAEAPMKVYAVRTCEPLESMAADFAMSVDELREPVLYATRELAEDAARAYNEEFNDPEPATVEEIEVRT
jgi:hypothetical protein